MKGTMNEYHVFLNRSPIVYSRNFRYPKFIRRRIKVGYNLRLGVEAHAHYSSSGVYSPVIRFLPGVYSMPAPIQSGRLFKELR